MSANVRRTGSTNNNSSVNTTLVLLTLTFCSLIDKAILAARCHAQVRPMSSCGVCVFVTFVDCVKTNKHIFKFYSSSTVEKLG